MTIKFQPNDNGAPAGKVADAALHFGGELEGLKLEGFSIWARAGGYNVVLPGRVYSLNGEKRTYTLLRAVSEPSQAERLKDRILEAWHAYQTELATAV